MKLTHLTIFLFLGALGLHAQDTTKVLFVGNSITYFNDMPQTFEAIANSMGDQTEVTVYAPGGTGFINHVSDANVYSHFQQGIWDYIVLQPGSNESPGYSEPIESTLERGRILKDSALLNNPCAKILFYEISYGVWGNTQANLDTYNATMDLIRGNLEYLADSTELFFAPAGESMRTAWNNDQSTLLWGSNGDIHPNAKGSYIIACSFYSSIFQKPSLGSSEISSLSSQEATEYQELSDTTVLHYLSDWRINTYNQFTGFNYVSNQLSVNFNSISLNIDSLLWDFGDGNTSANSVISHTYSQNGTYDVLLTTYKNGCSESKIETINLSSAGINQFTKTEITHVYPNPFSDRLRVVCNPMEEVKIINILGQEFDSCISATQTKNGLEIETSTLPKGTYILLIGNSNRLIYKN